MPRAPRYIDARRCVRMRPRRVRAIPSMLHTKGALDGTRAQLPSSADAMVAWLERYVALAAAACGAWSHGDQTAVTQTAGLPLLLTETAARHAAGRSLRH